MNPVFDSVAQTDAARFSTEWWWTVGIALGAIIIGAALINYFARRWVKRLVKRASDRQKNSPDRDGAVNLRRTATVAHFVISTFQVVVWAVVFLIVLASVGVNLGPLIAGAGIAGVALGFGAQAIVRDVLSGSFILVENQFDVGDAVDLQIGGVQVSGTVEALTLRVTSVRAFDGTLHHVPNGNIAFSSNRTRGWGRAIIDVKLPFDRDVEKAQSSLRELLTELGSTADEPFVSGLRQPPELLGVVDLMDDAQVVRIVARTIPSRRGQVERELRSRIAARLIGEGLISASSSVMEAHEEQASDESQGSER